MIFDLIKLNTIKYDKRITIDKTNIVKKIKIKRRPSQISSLFSFGHFFSLFNLTVEQETTMNYRSKLALTDTRKY